jgi:large subunit ribosomal protein L32
MGVQAAGGTRKAARPVAACFLLKLKAKDMAVPKRRTSHARQGKRRSHLHLKPMQIQYCNRCEQPVLPHHVCPNCGYYQNREVVPAEEEK